MDLLVITWNYPPRRGGIEGLIASLCAELSKTHAVHVITSHARVSGFNEKNVFRAPLPGLVAFSVYAIWRGAALLARDPRVRIVFGGSALVTPLILILSRIFGRQAIVQVHGLDVIYRNLIYQLLCVRWLKFCERIVANSNNTAALAESKGVATERLTVIPPGVRSDRFSISTDVVATKQSWNIEDKKIILFVGRLAKRKGIKEFIENSLLEIVREIPNTVFLIVGDNPTESLTHREDMVGEIKATVSKTELVSHVRLLGCLSDDEVIKLYHASDVVVLPALEASNDVEGFAIVALEAAAAGKPVVATRVGGIPDAIEDGKSGVLVEPGAYTCFSKVITSLLKDREFGLLKGQYGRCRVSKEFSWQHIIARYQDVFDAVTQ